jgi:thiol:disulfide interchange protein DsbG
MPSIPPLDLRPSTAAGWLGFLATATIFALAPGAQAAPAHPKAIKDALANGAKVVKSFPAVSGLRGWILSENGTYSVVYTTPDKRTLIVGDLFNEKGENLTDKYAERYFPRQERFK